MATPREIRETYWDALTALTVLAAEKVGLRLPNQRLENLAHQSGVLFLLQQVHERVCELYGEKAGSIGERTTHWRWSVGMEGKNYSTRRNFLRAVSVAALSINRKLPVADGRITGEAYNRLVSFLTSSRRKNAMLANLRALRVGKRIPHPRIQLDVADLRFCDSLLVPHDFVLLAKRLAEDGESGFLVSWLRDCFVRGIGYPERFGLDSADLENLKAPGSDILKTLRESQREIPGHLIERATIIAALTKKDEDLDFVQTHHASDEMSEQALWDCARHFQQKRSRESIATVMANRSRRLNLSGTEGYRHIQVYREQQLGFLEYLKYRYPEEVRPYLEQQERQANEQREGIEKSPP